MVEGGFKRSGGLEVKEGERAYGEIGIGVEGGDCWEESGRERRCRSNGWFLGDCSRQLVARVARNRMVWLIELVLCVWLSFCLFPGACRKSFRCHLERINWRRRRFKKCSSTNFG